MPESPWRPRPQKALGPIPSSKDLVSVALPVENIAAVTKSIKELRRGNQIKHIFTHRRLWMQIWEGNSLEAIELKDSNLKWVPLNQLGRYGLPQPIKVLLLGLNLTRGDDLKN